MSAVHTPGPWLRAPLDELVITDPNGIVIARISGGHSFQTRSEARANARLVRVAPHLLVALQGARTMLRKCEKYVEFNHHDMGLIDAALAAATGEPKP